MSKNYIINLPGRRKVEGTKKEVLRSLRELGYSQDKLWVSYVQGKDPQIIGVKFQKSGNIGSLRVYLT